MNGTTTTVIFTHLRMLLGYFIVINDMNSYDYLL
jgi:hypothetical protein